MHRPSAPPTHAAVAVVLIALVGAVGWSGSSAIDVALDGGVDHLVQRIRSWGAWGVVGALALMIAHSFVPFPSEVITIANGIVYGPIMGTVISWTGAMLGAVVAFGVGRALGRNFVARVLRPTDLRRIERWCQGGVAPGLLAARLLPMVAFNLINYAAALARVPWWTFLWTTAVGILPFTILLSVAGARVMTMPAWMWIAASVAVLLTWYLSRVARRMLERSRS